MSAGNMKFPSTASSLVRGKTWLNATLDNPEYFFAAYEHRKIPKHVAEYVEWVQMHYEVDTQAKRLTRCVARTPTPDGLAAVVPPPPVACSHAKTTRRGSGARFIRISCADCGTLLSNSERHIPVEEVFTCQHKRTDHRGSASLC